MPEHNAGIEELGCIENDLTQAKFRAREQFAADHTDPGSVME
jgi:hypothetical protein